MSQLISTSHQYMPSTRTTLIFTCFLLLFSIIFLLNYPSLYTSNNTLLTSASKLLSFSKTHHVSSTCDLFDGTWIYNNDSDPIYSPGSCPFVEREFNCFKNGRSDLRYLKYQWKPYGCHLPRFDAQKMMEMLRGKRLVFVGDSLNRNMCQSLVCSLKMFNVSMSRSGDFYSYNFKEYNCSIMFLTAPFLVQQWQLRDKRETLRIDTMNARVYKYRDADFLIFNTGHWWNHNKSRNGENFFQEGDVVHSKMDVGEAYTKALKTWSKWVDENVNSNKTKVFFRGFSNTHFQGGDWDTGGTCDNETGPITDEKLLTPYPWLMRTLETVIAEMKTPVWYLNITKLTDFRKDGHPSKFRQPGVRGTIQDCSHWCLPGVPDSWNQLLFSSLLLSLEGTNTTYMIVSSAHIVLFISVFFVSLGACIGIKKNNNIISFNGP